MKPGEPNGFWGRLFAYACHRLADLVEAAQAGETIEDVPERIGRCDFNIDEIEEG